MPTRIVTYVHRPKRPPQKRKEVPLAGLAVVRKHIYSPTIDSPPEEQPAKDDRKPAIATSISRKRARLPRAEPAAEPFDDPEANAAMRAWLERAKWGRGPERIS